MTPEEQDCYDALREDNDCLKQENDALAARLDEAVALLRWIAKQSDPRPSWDAIDRIDAFLAKHKEQR